MCAHLGKFLYMITANQNILGGSDDLKIHLISREVLVPMKNGRKLLLSYLFSCFGKISSLLSNSQSDLLIMNI